MDTLLKINEFINSQKLHIEDTFKTRTGYSICTIYPNISLSASHIEHIEQDEKDNLGALYESIISLDNKKNYGKYYTNETEIIDRMLGSIDLFSGRILEPACGTGNFLVAIVERIVTEMNANGKSNCEILDYIAENLYANDTDFIATQIAELNVLMVLIPTLVKAKKECSDYMMPCLKISNYDFTQKKVFNIKFSLIISNPPFVTMYGKRSRNMTEEKRTFYNTFDFVQNKHGNNKFNISMFFLENGLKLLDKGGQLSYILDISFFETAFVDIRKYIVNNYYIHSIVTGLQGFENVASGQIIINIVNKQFCNPEIVVKDFNSNLINTVNQNAWNSTKNSYKYYIPLTGIEKEIDSKVKSYDLLETYFPKKSLRTCCALTGKTEAFIVNPQVEHEHLVFPYIEGSKGLGGKFHKLNTERFIKYDYDLQIKLSNEFKEQLSIMGVKNKKRVTLGDKDAYLAPKIFIRQSATDIIATYTDQPYAANNSIYVLTTKKTDSDSINMLKYTCGILNSNLITFFCRINKIIRWDKGKTPQIKISDLKCIHINVDYRYFDEIVKLVDILLKNPQDYSAYDSLNKIVYSIYSINAKEMAFIEKYLSA